MKLILFLILSFNLFAQSDLLLLMDDSAPKLTELTGMEVWYKGDYGLTSSGWLDASGNSKDLHFNTTAWTPTLTGTKNGIPTALFDGTNDRTDSVLFTTTKFTIYMVVKSISHTNFEYFCDGGSTRSAGIRQGASSGILQFDQSSGVQAFNETVSVGTWAILVAQNNGTPLQKIYTQVNDNTLVGGSQIGTVNMGGFKLGGRFDNSARANFEIAEVIIYGDFHNATTITSVVHYLNTKYGVY